MEIVFIQKVMIFFFLQKKKTKIIHCGYSLEVFHRVASIASYEYLGRMFSWRNSKHIYLNTPHIWTMIQLDEHRKFCYAVSSGCTLPYVIIINTFSYANEEIFFFS